MRPRDAREFCAGIVCDPAYQQGIRQRALAGKLAPVVECMVWHYAHGKPAQLVQQTGNLTISWAEVIKSRLQRRHERVRTGPNPQQEESL